MTTKTELLPRAVPDRRVASVDDSRQPLARPECFQGQWVIRRWRLRGAADSVSILSSRIGDLTSATDIAIRS